MNYGKMKMYLNYFFNYTNFNFFKKNKKTVLTYFTH